MVNVAIVDYGSGNLRSAEKAFARAAREAGLAADIRVTADPDRVARADRVVLPGVGAFADCRRGLAAISGMIAAIEDAAIVRARPFLGICVGLQLMATRGLERQETAGFGWIPGDVTRVAPDDPALKIPHMGWNTIEAAAHEVLAGIPVGPQGLHAYFVHSYHLVPADPAHRLATADYGGPITAMVGRDTMVGTQFHPEKSQALGLALIGNFLKWTP